MLKPLAFVLATGALLAACGNDNPLRVVRATCPAAAVLQGAGEVTLFSPAESRDANAIDVTASITNLRPGCSDEKGGAMITNAASFDVVAQRRQTAGARDVTLPYFVAVVRAGDKLVAKQAGQVVLRFADGQARTQTRAAARADVSRAATTLPAEINEKLTRKRKATDIDAAVDPMNDPATRDAVRNASFELLVGFQLSDGALAYNIAK